MLSLERLNINVALVVPGIVAASLINPAMVVLEVVIIFSGQELHIHPCNSNVYNCAFSCNPERMRRCGPSANLLLLS